MPLALPTRFVTNGFGAGEGPIGTGLEPVDQACDVSGSESVIYIHDRYIA